MSGSGASMRVPDDRSRPFREPAPPLREGIYRALDRRPRVPPAQGSNFLPLTARLYEPLWRRRSLSLLTGGAFDVARELELLLDWLAPQPGERVLDAACSAGLYARTLLLNSPGLVVHALDFSLPFLRTARRYAEREGVRPELVLADVRNLPYPDAAFDAIACGGSLNEFTELGPTLKELARVLRPGGRMWLMYLTRSVSLPGRALQDLLRLSGIRFPRPEAVEEALQEQGLALVRADYRGPVALTLFGKAAGTTD